ncbi:hypothetical protein B0E46_16395 [Rhodanobacter sp. B04]|uniref:hypothetical protein n=1 Tax=Rhodanobacter sp. B04 TaxID=1945860 RepID=UPI000985A154|nr:hypothetical protein [Rhodanobacter sp. B04]OOG61546.1 hypothetical protein B0E46_16395 [Rhodanobacter sp. B04]
MTSGLVPMPNADLVQASDVPALLTQIRPAWRAKNLISRVHVLLSVDPSSACQRLFNAAIHDLREKVTVIGVDLASEAAKQGSLPPISKPNDIENYSTAKLIDLAYGIGLLSRPEWRRLHRCYEIRRDLEHEDNEYEAGLEDCVYIFKTCIEAVLSRDPIHVLRVTEVKQIVESSTAVAPSNELLDDYRMAPHPRQEEILKFLTSVALDRSQSDLVQQNAYAMIMAFEAATADPVKLSIAGFLQSRIGRGGIDKRTARVAHALGAFPYLRQAQRADFFNLQFAQMEQIGYHWTEFNQHGELLRSFKEYGAFAHCPPEPRQRILKWLVLLYVGEAGGRTSYGNVRNVFYSNSGAPIAAEIISEHAVTVRDDLVALRSDSDVARRLNNTHLARRYESLIDLLVED